MFGLFGKKKGKKGGKDGKTSPERAKLLAQANANAKAAREMLGDDTIQRIAEILKAKEGGAFNQAKKQIEAVDKDKVADHLKLMIEEERNKPKQAKPAKPVKTEKSPKKK